MSLLLSYIEIDKDFINFSNTDSIYFTILIHTVVNPENLCMRISLYNLKQCTCLFYKF